VLLSPRHPDVGSFAQDAAVRERLEELRWGGLERSSRGAEAIAVVATGHEVPAPAGGDPLPVLVSPVVDGRFGATAVLGIPEHDRTDAVIAERLAGDLAAAADGAGANGALAGGEGRQAPAPRPAVRYRADDFS